MPGAQVAFARRFGEVQVHVMNQYHANAHPELYTLSNLGPDGKRYTEADLANPGNKTWQSMLVPPTP